jgi:hypothetical protein
MTGRLLVAYSNAANFVSTTAEYLESFGRYCDFEVRYVHVTNGAKVNFDLNEFDAVFQNYCVRLPVDNYVSSGYIEQMKTFRGVKLLAAQDEYESTNKLKAAIRKIGYHVLFTNASGHMIDRLYPRREFPRTEVITVLTGYVPERVNAIGKGPRLGERPIHIGYRCRRLPAYFGRLGFEKFEIGRRMHEICTVRGIPHDIEWTEDKRLYGDAWYDFIASCRTNLGSETGSNVFDFDGAIRAKYEKMSAARGSPMPFEEFCRYTDPVEADYDIGQISPRIFEAAAIRTALVLFSGKYLGLISPDEHYIELKKDFSNLDAVLERLTDVEALERMAERAYDRLVGSGEFSYRRFARLVEDTIRRKADELRVPLRAPVGRFGATEFGIELEALAELRERPTVAPRHPAFFLYQDAIRQNKYYKERNEYLNTLIAEQNQYFVDQIARLKNFYSSQLEQLNGIAMRGGGATRRWGLPRLKVVMNTLISYSWVRRLGRKVMAHLPNRLERRIKLRLILLLNRW